MMYSAYKLNKQGDNIQPWHTPFPIWNQSVVSCPVLTLASWLAYRFLKKQQLELDIEQGAGSKLGKEYVKAVHCHPAYLTYMQSTSCNMLGWMKQAGIKISGRNINNLRYAEDTTIMAESEELKSLLMKVK